MTRLVSERELPNYSKSWCQPKQIHFVTERDVIVKCWWRFHLARTKPLIAKSFSSTIGKSRNWRHEKNENCPFDWASVRNVLTALAGGQVIFQSWQCNRKCTGVGAFLFLAVAIRVARAMAICGTSSGTGQVSYRYAWLTRVHDGLGNS